MGFPPVLRTFLARIYSNNDAVILLADGQRTQRFPICIGIKQGFPLSPTITNLVVDPIVRSVSVLATLLGYVDDLNLVAHIFAEFKRAAMKLAELLYMAKFDLGIDAVGKSKTAVMTNCPDLTSFELTVSDPTTYEQGRPETVTYRIPILKGEETYKYLGFLMNINLTWTAQQAAVASKLQYHTQLLRRKCFPATQTPHTEPGNCTMCNSQTSNHKCHKRNP